MPLTFIIIDPTRAKRTWDRIEAVVVVLDWSTQYWHPQLLCIAMEEPLHFSSSKNKMELAYK